MSDRQMRCRRPNSDLMPIWQEPRVIDRALHFLDTVVGGHFRNTCICGLFSTHRGFVAQVSHLLASEPVPKNEVQSNTCVKTTS